MNWWDTAFVVLLLAGSGYYYRKWFSDRISARRQAIYFYLLMLVIGVAYVPQKGIGPLVTLSILGIPVSYWSMRYARFWIKFRAGTLRKEAKHQVQVDDELNP